jgi:hypothetical protein
MATPAQVTANRAKPQSAVWCITAEIRFTKETRQRALTITLSEPWIIPSFDRGSGDAASSL